MDQPSALAGPDRRPAGQSGVQIVAFVLALLWGAGMMFLTGLLWFFVPKLESFFKLAEGELPVVTVFVLNVSDESRAMWLLWVLGWTAGVAGLAILSWRWRSAVPCVLAILLLLLTASAVFLVWASALVGMQALGGQMRGT